jgi:hypothetical protein
MNPKIIICDCDHKDVEIERAVFEKAGYDFKWLHCKTEQDVIEQCQGAVCLLNQYACRFVKHIGQYGNVKIQKETTNEEDASAYY